MIINMTGGGGGTALNFKVVPGLTQPGTASENTIWVKTERIGSWYFSATQPEGLQEWDVWFPTGTESLAEYNALRKNGLQVYPLRSMQYISGTLVSKPAYIYQNGKWNDISYTIMRDGEYVATFMVDVQNVGSDKGILSDGSGRLFTRPYTINAAVILKTEDMVPKNVNKLKVIARLETGTGKGVYNMFFLSTYGTWPESYNNQIATVSLTESDANREYILNLSNVTSDAYLWVACAMGGNVSPRVVIKDIVEVE